MLPFIFKPEEASPSQLCLPEAVPPRTTFDYMHFQSPFQLTCHGFDVYFYVTNYSKLNDLKQQTCISTAIPVGQGHKSGLPGLLLAQGLSRSGSGVRRLRFPAALTAAHSHAFGRSLPLLVLAGGLAALQGCLSVLPAMAGGLPRVIWERKERGREEDVTLL